MPRKKQMPETEISLANKLPDYCQQCGYLGRIASTETCDYYLQTCIRRGCDVGEGCTRRKEKSECALNWNRRISL